MIITNNNLWSYHSGKWRFIIILKYWQLNQEWRRICADKVRTSKTVQNQRMIFDMVKDVITKDSLVEE